VSLSWAETTRRVVSRAADRCEYCFMHQALQGATFHVEHITPQTRGGGDHLDNLCLACPRCNLMKSDRTTAVDPLDGSPVPLFNPRTERWRHHCEWDGYRVVALTPVGRGLVETLGLNEPRRLRIREAESLFGLFPPADDPSS
jgi:HNH endonuclease